MRGLTTQTKSGLSSAPSLAVANGFLESMICSVTKRPFTGARDDTGAPSAAGPLLDAMDCKSTKPAEEDLAKVTELYTEFLFLKNHLLVPYLRFDFLSRE